MPEDRKHSAEAKLLVKDFIAAQEEISDGCAETFPFELIEDLRREYFPDWVRKSQEVKIIYSNLASSVYQLVIDWQLFSFSDIVYLIFTWNM